MWVYYTKHIYLREKKGAREKNKADLFETTVHYWGKDENNNVSYVPAVGGERGADSFGAPLPHMHSTEPQWTLSFSFFSG